jgi:hypothetical protein
MVDDNADKRARHWEKTRNLTYMVLVIWAIFDRLECYLCIFSVIMVSDCGMMTQISSTVKMLIT